MNKPTRRVKGNSTPPEDDLPIQYWAPDDIEMEKQAEKTTNDTVDFILAFAIIVGSMVVITWAFGRGLI